MWSFESGKLQEGKRKWNREVDRAERGHTGESRASRGGGRGGRRMRA